MITSTRQLPQTTIHVNDFQDSQYSFPIDSVLTAESVPSKMVISASEGYLLTTSSVSQPKREQSLTYKKQADGQWAIHSVVTITTSEQEFPDGSVRIQNAQAGTTILTIQGETTALARIPTSSVVISETALSFGKTAPGQSRSLLFTVSQPYADELVTITSDTPEYFQLATDSHPRFTASLSIKPSLVATYVHVRYLAKKAGTYHGQVLIQSAFDEQTIELTGRTARFLSTTRANRPLNGYARPERRNTARWIKISAAIALVAVIAGVGWFGFVNRQARFVNDAVAPSVVNEKTVSTSPTLVSSKPIGKTTPESVRVRSESREDRAESKSVALKKQLAEPAVTDPIENTKPKSETRLVEQRIKEQKELTAKPTESLVTKRPYRQARPVQAVGESELEKELNQSPHNQP